MANPNDIAIVGMALRVPGARDVETFWENLRDGREALVEVSAADLKSRGVSAALVEDPNYVRAGMPLAGFDEFDPEFFGFSPIEAAILDPQHRQFYEVAWEALESAGCVPARFDGAIGVFGGCGAGSYFSRNILQNAELLRSVGYFLLRHTGNDKDFLATRVSYAFNLKGPSISVQTACSTSLVATHMGVQSLLARETDLVLAGGVTIEIPHGIGYLYHEGEIQSPDGHCRPFDHRSQGTVFGSGVGVVALRRLEDALRDGNPVYAVIRSSAINNDGASKVGYLAPSVDGQAAAISEALALADIDSGSIEFVECHGTGTPMGDPIEVAALNQAFGAGAGKGTCILGSVKANIGHLDTAAGVISLIKAALSLQREAIPPTPNFEAPNPTLGLENGPFTVTSDLVPWPRRAGIRRAAVNSLGVGGTNAFVVLEEAPLRPAAAALTGAQLLTFSARSRHALDAMQQRLLEWLQKNPALPLGQVAANLRRGREAFEHRRCVAAASVAEAVSLLDRNDATRVFTHVADGQAPPVVFMFPGGGAQYPAMAADLYRAAPAFRAAMDEGFGILARDFNVDLKAVFLKDAATSTDVDALLNRPSVQLPLVFLIEYALVSMWKACGVEPAALIGHSMGENTAACIAGVLSLKDGLGLVLLRGQLMDEVPDGGMLSVSMGATELAERLGEDLDLAAANSPMLSIASGPWPALEALQERLKSEGIDSRRVRINIAAHSRLLDGILQRFGDYLRGIRLNPPSLPIVSNHTGKWLTAEEAQDPEYWIRHLRNTIRFVDGVKLLLEDKSRVYLEVGPGNILGSFVRQSHAAVVQRVLASLRHPDDITPDDVFFRTVAGRLWALGLPLADGPLWSHDSPMLPLPTYAFQHERFWIETSAPEPGVRAEEFLRPDALPFGDDWLTGPRWIQLGIPEFESDRKLNWCVFHHHDALAKSCIEMLRRRGDHVTEVIGGDTFARVDDDTFTLAPEVGGSAYDELLKTLVDENRVPDRILHTWLLTRSESFRPGQTFLHRNQVHGFYSLFHLARAFAKRAEGKSSHWIVAGNGVVSIAGEPVIYPEKATVLGPCAVIPRELKGVTCAYADVVIGDGDAPVHSAYGLLQELNGPAVNAVLAWRDRVRWMRYLAPHHPKASGKPAYIRDGGTYLITGGFGGIAGVIAEWLARDHRARLLLLSRTPLPHRDAWDEWLLDHPGDPQSTAIRRIRKLEALGAKVEALSADVTVQEQVEEAIAGAKALSGAIHGVFHTAGVLHDGLIALKNERDIEEVLAAKLYGTLVLDQVLRNEPMDFMLLFSSISTFTAPVGQVDYVAANAFLNAFAEACRDNRPYPVVALNWGIWRDVGMAATAMDGQHRDAAHDAHPGRLESVRYPLFSERRAYKEGRSQLHLLSGTLSATRSWITDDHRLRSGQSLVPGSGYLELIRAALMEIGEADAPWKASAVRFLEPFYVHETEEREFRIQLRGTPGKWHFELDVQQGPTGALEWRSVATARIATAAPSTPKPLDIPRVADRCKSAVQMAVGEARLRTRQEAHLLFGPRWQVLQSIQFGQGEALATLNLAAGFRHDLAEYPLHPGLLDVATGCAMDLIPGYQQQDVPTHLWVPVGYDSFECHAPLNAAMFSWIRLMTPDDVTSGIIQFDVVLTDTTGVVLAVAKGLTLRRIEGQLAEPSSSLARIAAVERNAAAQRRGPAEQALAHNLARGIRPEEGIGIVQRLLASIDRPVVLASSMDPRNLMKQADTVARMERSESGAKFARPRLETSFEPPRDEIERALAEIWGKLLGVDGVGIRDSFFDLGGHSLIAVRLFNEVSDRFDVDLPMSALIQTPDVAGLAERIRGGPVGASTASSSQRAQVIEEPFQFVVPMVSGPAGGGLPLFVVAGMFGNVLNLSHLAHLMGEDRAFFALQARGLLGGEEPHDSFEDAARDYLLEVRRIQPHGPYLLGGYSGGGLIAFEMARQLEQAGEKVGAVVLLDTPIREPQHLSIFNKVEMWLPGLKKEGLKFLQRKLRERTEWRRELEEREEARRSEGVNSARFHSQRVGDAFIRALARYEVHHADAPAVLFRPKLKVKYRLRDGRLLDAGREVLRADNGWSSHVGALSVVEVPGNHDSMVLEPNVRVLAAAMRKALAELETQEMQGIHRST